MNRSTVLAVGLLSMAMFAILCVRHNVAAIHDDLMTRSGETLAALGAGWADVSVAGRDVSLGGVAPDLAARDGAAVALRGLRGVRRVHDQTVLSSQAGVAARRDTAAAPAPAEDTATTPATPRAAAGPYWFSVTRSTSGTSLEGLMPDQRSTDALVAMARRRFGDDSVDDRTQIQTGAPPAWRDATGVALILAGALVEGEVAVRGRSVFVTGLAASDAAVEEIRIGIQTALPEGYAGTSAAQPAQALTELLRTAPGAARRLAERRADRVPAPSVNAPPANAPAAVAPRPEAAAVTEPQPSPSARACQESLDALLARRRVVFETGSALIDGRSRSLLDDLAKAAAGCPAARIEIGGHTDDQGTEENNLALSQRRAEAVMQYLASRGVAVSRMTARGYGEARPLVPNRTADHRARNRRIEMKILEDD